MDGPGVVTGAGDSAFPQVGLERVSLGDPDRVEVPGRPRVGVLPRPDHAGDPFERARERLERLLDEIEGGRA